VSLFADYICVDIFNIVFLIMAKVPSIFTLLKFILKKAKKKAN